MKKLHLLFLTFVLTFTLSACTLPDFLSNQAATDTQEEEEFKDDDFEDEDIYEEEFDEEELDMDEATDLDDDLGAESDLESDLIAAFVTKFGKDPADVNINIGKQTATHASGGVTFEGEMGGGWWLSALVNGTWVLVADGNGTVPCENIEPYDFPTTMAPECWDEATQTLIYR